MDNALYVALSRQQILRREMDVVANNIANADTPGFKVEQVISQTDAKSLPGTTAKLQFALDTGLSRDFGQGALSQTGRDLDVAIEGDGFSRSTLSAASGCRRGTITAVSYSAVSLSAAFDVGAQ